ncbi:bifunctional riboflavin kinase/FAD synthetase [Collinsella sp. i06-0019-1H4]|uniref:riboflavin biosynthesis protein RibF n=1 Tax=Collinsella sp. i06-0019-1H4 TaxID=3132706 RepID=UPI0034BB1D38
MMLTSHELARIFFAGESDEARIVAADAFEDCACLGTASIAIGVFDGVHRGHRELIDAVVRDARNHGCKAVVVTFDPDPDVVVSSSPAQKLMTTSDRLHALALTGADAVVAVPFTPAVAALDHVGFLELLSRVVDICSIRVGSDFRLGRGGASGVAEMQTWGAEHGVDVYGHELLCVEGQTICATRIRQELRQGHVELAAELLGRPYMLRGIVAGGRHQGSDMGFPTANIQVPEGIQVPADGVYEGLVLVDDTVWPAAVNVGLPPTYADDAASAHLEANLIGYAGDLYGASVSLAFTRWLRPSRVFDSLDELIATVEGNIDDIRHHLGEQGVSIRD